MLETIRTRPPLRRPHAAPEPGVHGGRGGDHLVRLRSRHDDLQRDQRGGAPAAARHVQSRSAVHVRASHTGLQRRRLGLVSVLSARAGPDSHARWSRRLEQGLAVDRASADRDTPSTATSSAATTSPCSASVPRSAGSSRLTRTARRSRALCVVVSHGFWESRLGADSSAIGRDVQVNGQPYTLIGVDDARLSRRVLTAQVDAWVPLMMQPQVRPGLGSRRSSPGCGCSRVSRRVRRGRSRNASWRR